MHHHHRPQVPRETLVAETQTEEIQQDIEHVSLIALRRRAVVVFELGVIFDERFDHDAQQVDGLGARDVAIERVEQSRPRFRVVVFFQASQIRIDALVQHRAKVAEIEKLRREEVAAVALDKVDERFPTFLVGRLFQRR